MAKLSLLDPTKTGRPAQDLESKLRRCIVGQEEAIHEVVRGYQTYAAGLCAADRPIGNFLFLGPTGSGKTHIRVSHREGSPTLMFFNEAGAPAAWNAAGLAAA